MYGLRRPGCDSQIEIHVDSDGHKCLRFTDDAQSKTNQGGLMRKFNAPKVVHVYPNANPQRCLVRLYEKYTNLIPTMKRATSFYLRPKDKCTPKPWYDDRPLGINKIRPIIHKLCMLAGFTDGKFINRSGQSTSLTRSRMYDKNQD